MAGINDCMYIGVGSFSIWGGGANPARQLQYLGGGGGIAQKYVRMRAHAHVCTHMC